MLTVSYKKEDRLGLINFYDNDIVWDFCKCNGLYALCYFYKEGEETMVQLVGFAVDRKHLDLQLKDGAFRECDRIVLFRGLNESIEIGKLFLKYSIPFEFK